MDSNATFPSIFWELSFGMGQEGGKRKGWTSLYLTGYGCILLGCLLFYLIFYGLDVWLQHGH